MNSILLVLLLNKEDITSSNNKYPEVKLSNILIIVGKGIRSIICRDINRYEEAKCKYKANYHKNKESLYLQCWNVHNLYWWAMSQEMPGNDFKRLQKTS